MREGLSDGPRRPRFTAFYFTETGTVPAQWKDLGVGLSRGSVPFKLIPLTQRLASDLPA